MGWNFFEQIINIWALGTLLTMWCMACGVRQWVQAS